MKILVTALFSQENREKINRAAQQEEVIYCDEGSAAVHRDAAVIIGNPSIETLKEFKALRLLQSVNAGVEKYTLNSQFPQKLILCNMSGAFGTIISEYIIGSILCMYRRFFQYRQNQKSKIWKDAGSELSLCGKTAVIFGTGDIGCSTALRLKAFGVRTVGIRRNAKIKPQGFDAVYGSENAEEALKQADIVIGCMPQTQQTKHMLDYNKMKQLKDNAIIVNVGRGSFIVTEDLIKVLNEGKIMGAVLDVTEPEPLAEDSPLWNMENVLITPHVSGIGFGHTKETEDRIADICCYNIKAFINGEALKNKVDIKSGCRSMSNV